MTPHKKIKAENNLSELIIVELNAEKNGKNASTIDKKTQKSIIEIVFTKSIDTL